MNFPDNDDGALLQMLFDHGVDLAAPQELEFGVLCRDETAALKVEKELQDAGYQARAIYDEGELEEGEQMTETNEEFWPSWSVVVAITMIPHYDEIVKIQAQLNILAKPFGGEADGWGAVI